MRKALIVLVVGVLGMSAACSKEEGGAAASGGTAPAARVANYFGGSWQNTSYLGAAQSNGAQWWLGWTAYAIN